MPIPISSAQGKKELAILMKAVLTTQLNRTSAEREPKAISILKKMKEMQVNTYYFLSLCNQAIQFIRCHHILLNKI
ncbi:MAG: hypothetical protein EZS28_011411 [Streblomastix strix]|uniref:Uncharacterized protein n=1 Tax=Streblomastix strix TaxID=222440 RepID=A0A5J4WEE6_9EUKA|nr:MAG: hypothetical protein EZS28_011410 [Streblomastix strix]KAA6393063.1 MAG: hypothetical protein EZS28_011411 [Streblomastix strix]